jgi:serine/threonine protein phosphatase PrpC
MLRHSAVTHAGNKLDHNEDALGCDLNSNLLLVADGMGGHACGEVASEIASITIPEHFARTGSLVDSIVAAHRAILVAVEKDESYAGMGSTVVALCVRDQTAEVAWVGDSRAYLWRDGKLTPISKDHSVLEEMVDAGQLTRAQAQNHPQRNVITQVLGVENPVPSQRSVAILPKDWILLCSDGLTDEMDDAAITKVLRSCQSVAVAADTLLQRTLELRAKDNISVIVAEPIPGKSTKRRRLGLLVAFVAVVVASALLLY